MKLMQSMSNTNSKLILQSRPGTWRNTHWNDAPELLNDPEGIDTTDLPENVIQLIKELDRRFIQLYDKVQFENSKEVK